MRPLLYVSVLGLAGCGYSSYYPDYPDYLLDTASATVPGSENIPCSLPYGELVGLTLVSTVDVTLHLGSVTADTCTELPYTDLAPRQSMTFSVGSNLVWTVRDDNGALLLVFQTPPGETTWTQYLP